MSEISISCDGRDTLSGFQEKVVAGEIGGAVAIWIANHLFQRDPITLAAMSLVKTGQKLLRRDADAEGPTN